MIVFNKLSNERCLLKLWIMFWMNSDHILKSEGIIRYYCLNVEKVMVELRGNDQNLGDNMPRGSWVRISRLNFWLATAFSSNLNSINLHCSPSMVGYTVWEKIQKKSWREIKPKEVIPKGLDAMIIYNFVDPDHYILWKRMVNKIRSMLIL